MGFYAKIAIGNIGMKNVPAGWEIIAAMDLSALLKTVGG